MPATSVHHAAADRSHAATSRLIIEAQEEASIAAASVMAAVAAVGVNATLEQLIVEALGDARYERAPRRRGSIPCRHVSADHRGSGGSLDRGGLRDGRGRSGGRERDARTADRRGARRCPL